MAYAIEDFKTYFARDFTYSDTPTMGVTDGDLQRAFDEASINFNANLFKAPQDQTAFFYLAAHFLATGLQMATQGKNSVGTFPVSSRSVGAVLEAYAVPEWATKNPTLSSYASTRYGQRYLELLYPRMIGRVTVYRGATTP